MGYHGIATGTVLTISIYLLIWYRQAVTVKAAPTLEHNLIKTIDNPSGHIATRYRSISNRFNNKYVRLHPNDNNIDVLIDEDDGFGDVSKRQFDDYGHMRFGKREDRFDDYGHMRFGRNSLE